MSRTRIPDDVLSAAHARARARAGRDWSEADRLRDEIEAAGWTVVDRGTDFALAPAHPPDVEAGGRVRYGSAATVPSRLSEPPVGVASVVVTATGQGMDAAMASVQSVAAHLGPGTGLIVVADDASAEQLAELERAALGGGSGGDEAIPRAEVLATSAPFGAAEGRNAGIRRASAAVVILLDAGAVASGDFVTPLVDVLSDPTVAVAGPWGLASGDGRRFQAAGPGEVDAISLSCLAFRRDAYVARGPLDRRFQTDAYLDVWWSFVLRDAADEGALHRRAVAVDGLPVARAIDGAAGAPAGDRAARRNFYRLLDRFGSRRDLLSGS